jgi:hypothetical protein
LINWFWWIQSIWTQFEIILHHSWIWVSLDVIGVSVVFSNPLKIGIDVFNQISLPNSFLTNLIVILFYLTNLLKFKFGFVGSSLQNYNYWHLELVWKMRCRMNWREALFLLNCIGQRSLDLLCLIRFETEMIVSFNKLFCLATSENYWLTFVW